MGLLDDAIRDHLELKRLRGADPGEVAREQEEALTPVLAEGPAAEDEPLLVLEDLDVETSEAEGPEGAHGGEETAELDMRTVLGEAPADPAEQSAPETAGVAPAAPQVPPVHGSGRGTPEWDVLENSAAATPANPDTTTIR